MISPVYILSADDYENLIFLFNDIRERIEELPDCQAKTSIGNYARTGLFVLGKDTE